MSTIPTAEEIVSLYLYGQLTPPANLKTEQLIRPPGLGITKNVDVNEYMTTGGGRFVKVENFLCVRNFLAADDSNMASLHCSQALIRAINYWRHTRKLAKVGLMLFSIILVLMTRTMQIVHTFLVLQK